MGWTNVERSSLTGARPRWVMLGIVLLLLVAAAAPKCSAQTWGEFFNQKKTQRKYLLNQITALQAYIGYAKKGYAVVSEGINTVGDISRGEFGLHSAFISGLKRVSPAVRNDARVAEIIAMQLSILKGFSSLKAGGQLSAEQMSYVAEVSGGVTSACYQDLSELLLIVSSGELEMNDKERLERLDQVHARMVEKSGFTSSFCLEVKGLISQKATESETLQKLRRYYGIN